jgi:hypothetical protein
MSWTGWLLPGLLLLQNAAAGLAAPAGGDPLEGHPLQHTDGSFYLYMVGSSSPCRSSTWAIR